MYITIDQYAEGAAVSDATASRRLKGIPFVIPKRGRGVQWYPLAAAVQTLKEKEVARVPSLVQRARDLNGGDLYIEATALEIAESFINWTRGDMQARARAAQNSFVVAVSNSRVCTPTIVRNLEPLKTLFVLNKGVVGWILVGGTPPDVDNLAPSFAVACNSPGLDKYHAAMELAA